MFYKVLCISQFVLFCSIVYFGELAKSNSLWHIILANTLFLVSVWTCLTSYLMGFKGKYPKIVLAIIVLASILGYLIRVGILPKDVSDYFGLLMQFGIAYSLLLLFDMRKIPSFLNTNKFIKITFILLSWQILSGVILRAHNKTLFRLADNFAPNYLFYGVHLLLAIIILFVLYSLCIYLFSYRKQVKWYSSCALVLAILTTLQIAVGLFALVAVLKREEFQTSYLYIRPFHFINSGWILGVILLLKKGEKI